MGNNNIIKSAILLLLFSAMACKDQPVVKDIPLSMRDSSYRRMKRNYEDKMGLSSLENGFRDLQIRILRGYAFTDSTDLILLTKIDTKWSVQLYKLVFQYDKNFDLIVAINKRVTIKQPKSGWQIFTDSLLKLDILTLPDFSTIPGYYLSTDSDGPTIEIATADEYRIYGYPNFESYVEKKIEAKKVYLILKLIEEELDFKWLRRLPDF
jgi:hypothetical protein